MHALRAEDQHEDDKRVQKRVAARRLQRTTSTEGTPDHGRHTPAGMVRQGQTIHMQFMRRHSGRIRIIKDDIEMLEKTRIQLGGVQAQKMYGGDTGRSATRRASGAKRHRGGKLRRPGPTAARKVRTDCESQAHPTLARKGPWRCRGPPVPREWCQQEVSAIRPV